MDIAVRKSTRNGLKNKANNDVIRQAHLKQEMMSNEQMGPTQISMMYDPPITAPDPGGGGGYGHEINDQNVTNMLKVNRNIEPSPDDIQAMIDEYYEVFTIKLEQDLEFDEDKIKALQSEIDEACKTIKKFQLLFPHPALNKLLFDLNGLHHILQEILIDLFLENIKLDRYGSAREGLVEAPVLKCTSCKRLLEDDFAQCPCNIAQKFCVSCCPFQEPENSHEENNESEYLEQLTLFTEIKTMLYSMLLPQDEVMKNMIEDALDIEVIKQQIDAGVLEFDKYARRILVLMEILCEPVRDEQIAALKQITEMNPLFGGIMRTLEAMKQDMANFTIHTVRETNEKDSKDCERLKSRQPRKTPENEDLTSLSGMDNFLDLSNVPVKQPNKVEEFSSDVLFTMNHFVENPTSKEDNDCRVDVVNVDDNYDSEMLGNDKEKLLDDPKSMEAEASNLDNLTSPGLNQNSNFAKEMQIERCVADMYADNNDDHIVSTKEAGAADGTYEDNINNHIVNTSKDRQLADTKEDSPGAVDGNGENEMPETKLVQENTKDDIPEKNHNRYQENIDEDDVKTIMADATELKAKNTAKHAAHQTYGAIIAAAAGKKGTGSYKLAAAEKKVKRPKAEKPAKLTKKPAKKAAKKAAKEPAAEPKAKKPAKKARKPTKKADKMPAAKKAANNSVMIREHDFNKQCSMVAKPNSQPINVTKLTFPFNPGDECCIPLLG